MWPVEPGTPVQTDETYAYDANGNRDDDNYDVSPGNRMLTDGTYHYAYDDNGNREFRYVDDDDDDTFSDGDTGVTRYYWDYRNRLVKAAEFGSHADATGGTDNVGINATQTAEYVYDAFNNRISKIVDEDGDGAAVAVRTNFALLDGEVYLEFNGTDLSHRYMPGPGIDMNLMIEQMNTSNGSSVETLWALTDHQGTVRDVIAVINNTGTVQNHIKYNSFGAITYQLDDEVEYRFTYTGRELDAETGLYYYRARYYDADNGKFISEDPIGFGAGDANLYRYVGNNPGNWVDPMGLKHKCGKMCCESLSSSDPTGLAESSSRDPIGYADGVNLYEYVRSGPVDALDPTGLEDHGIKLPPIYSGPDYTGMPMPELWSEHMRKKLGSLQRTDPPGYFRIPRIPRIPVESRCGAVV